MAEIVVKSKLRQIKGKYYAQLSWKLDGVYQSTCLATGIRVDGVTDGVNIDKLSPSKKRKLEKKAYEDAILKMDELRHAKIVDIERNKSLFFRECALEWLDSCAKNGLKTNTVAIYTYAVKSRLIPQFGDRKLTDITKKDIENFYDSLLAEGKTKNTVKHYHVYLTGIFKLGVRNDILKKAPTDNFSFKKAYKSKAKAFDSDQLQKIREAVEGTFLEVPVYLALYCGLRRSEALGLLWDNVDLDNDELRVVTTMNSVTRTLEHSTKSISSKRALPIMPALKQVLLKAKAMQTKNREFFGNRYGHGHTHNYVAAREDGSPLSSDTVSKKFTEMVSSLGFEGYTFHSLRHTYATYMASASASISPFVIQNMLGHGSVTTTDIYVHPDMKAKINAAQVLAEMYGDTKK